MSFQVIQGDCLAEMAKLPPNSVDACITDPPYGTTACSWDSVIPFAPMWAELKRIVKPKGAIVLFGSQPFTSALVMSNPAMFKYSLVWDKVNRSSGYANANARPLKRHEDLCVFSEAAANSTALAPMTYNPQDLQIHGRRVNRSFRGDVMGERPNQLDCYIREFCNYPDSILAFEAQQSEGNGHGIYKPVDLLRYLVRTYTNAGDTVLDFTCGSGTTGVACEIEGRDSINIDSDGHYCEVARARMTRASGIACDIPKRVKEYAPTPLFEQVAC